MRLYYFIVHEDADARQSRRVWMRLKSSGAISMMIRVSQRQFRLSRHEREMLRRCICSNVLTNFRSSYGTPGHNLFHV